MVWSIAYRSRMTEPFSLGSLVRLGNEARLANAPLHVTGVLFYDEGGFIQVLEGDRSILSRLFARIAADARHKDVVKIANGRIRSRLFDDWSMRMFDMADLIASEAALIEQALSPADPQSAEAVNAIRRATAFAGADLTEVES